MFKMQATNDSLRALTVLNNHYNGSTIVLIKILNSSLFDHELSFPLS